MSGGYLLGDDAVDVDAWRQSGGGEGLRRAHEIGPEETISIVRDSRLRGRGGAGFPTGVKWAGAADRPTDQDSYLVCNAAEGEPGTFKDRHLIRMNPFQVLEGIAIAAFSIGATTAYIGIKEQYHFEIQRLQRAATDMEGAGLLGEISIEVITGPDDYLLGEEKALLEVIEGRDPLPRQLPPYLLGLHTGTMSGVGSGSVGATTHSNPTVVNNVETLAHVPHIVARGSDWFRSIGTQDSPGSMVFTISGDVATETVVELPMGTPLAVLLHGVGGGSPDGRDPAFVFPGASNAPLTPAEFDVPMDFESLRAIGSGLGSGGMIVGDTSACPVGSARVLTAFLARESCGQCPPCKIGTARLEQGLADLSGSDALDEVGAWIVRVTDANRCGLGAGARALVDGLLRSFPEHVAEHLDGQCSLPRDLGLAKLVDFLPEAGRFVRASG